MKKKHKLTLEGKGRDIFFEEDDKTIIQQNDLSTNQHIDKKTYHQQNLKRVTFYVSPDIHKRIKVESANRDMKISEFVNEILNGYFENEDKKEFATKQ